MASSTERVLEDLQRVVQKLEGLMTDAAETAGRDVRRGIRRADRYVRDNAWESVAAVAAIAFIAGLLLGRRD
jgi:ElaB/YqjD/DUF883 family membrane-anchored ribosome-binding protein